MEASVPVLLRLLGFATAAVFGLALATHTGVGDLDFAQQLGLVGLGLAVEVIPIP